MANERIRKYFEQPDFKNKWEMCKMDTQFFMQVMQQDPRFMEVFQVLTGIDLMDMSANAQKQKEAEEERQRQREAERKRREEEEEKERLRKEAEDRINHMSEEEKEQIRKAKEAEMYKDLGNKAYKDKNFELAIKHYDSAIALNPSDMTYYTNKAAVYMEMKDFDTCIALCDEAIKQKELGNYDYQKLAKAWARKANALAKQQRFDDAIQAYDCAMIEHNDNAYKLAQKDIKKLKKKIEDENFINPEISEVHKQKGNEYMTAGQFPEAIEEYTLAIKRNPTNAALYSNRCAAYIKVMDLSNALKDSQKGLEIDPKFAKLYLRMGNVYNLMKQYHKALEAYD